MLGFYQAPPASLNEEEVRRLREARCGLCRAVKRRYGQIPRICATYDLALYILLCGSLEEAFERRGAGPCVAHPFARNDYASSRFTDYAADLSVALAYHAAIGDREFGRGLRARVVESSLAKAHARAMVNIPEQCESIMTTYARVRRIERDPDAGIDAVADEIGSLAGELLSWGQEDAWEPRMRELGASLGRLACYVDALASLEGGASDERRGILLRSGLSPGDERPLIEALVNDALSDLGRLPLGRDGRLLRTALGFDVWQKLDERREHHQNRQA